MMFLTLGASAQISNVKTKEAVKTVARFRVGLCSLQLYENIYDLALKSSNKFDDPVIVYLGEGKESTLQTLNDLIELHKSMKKGETAEFTITIKGKDFNYRVSKYDALNFNFTNVGAAGNVFFATTEMKTLISKLSEE